MKISELSKKTDVSMRSLRYYEEKDLIHPGRLDNGYRDYDESIVNQVQAIKLYFQLGLNIDEIRRIVDCDPFVFPNEQLICDKVLNVYQDKLKEVDNQLKSLEKVRSQLNNRITKIKEFKETIDGGIDNDKQ